MGILRDKVEPFEIEIEAGAGRLLEKMGRTGFQAKSLSLGVDIWQAMLLDRTTIFLGLAGAMVPAGMRKVISFLIKNRYIDCLVSTGANLFHDIHETRGRFHWQGHHRVDDVRLREEGIDRIYDVFALEDEFIESDRYIYSFSKTLNRERPYTTREFLYLIGKKLSEEYDEEGILTSAYKARVPIYCPAIGDSSIGIALAMEEGCNILFDTVEDVRESAKIVIEADKTGVIYIGGGTPKNFIQQTEVTAGMLGDSVEGHEYAIQVTMDSPHWGGLSGCTFEEAQSWGKISREARRVMIYCDSTIALPLIVSALAERTGDGIKRQGLPALDFLWKGLS